MTADAHYSQPFDSGKDYGTATPSIRDWAGHLRLFYQYARWRLLLLFVVTSSSGLFEALGIVTLLPILNYAFGDKPDDPVSKVIVGAIERLGVEPGLTNLLILLAAIFVVRGLAMFAHLYIANRTVTVVRRNAQMVLVRAIGAMDFPFYARNTTGGFTNLLLIEVNRFAASLRAFCKMGVGTIHALFYVPAAVAIDSELTLFLAVIGAMSILALRTFTRRTAAASLRVSELNDSLNARLVQLIHSFPYLKATASLRPVTRAVMGNIGGLAAQELKIAFNTSLVAAVKEPIAVVALCGYAYYQLVLGEGSMAEVMVLALLLYRLLIQLLNLPPEYNNFNRTVGGVHAVRRWGEALERNRERKAGEPVVDLARRITFRDVSFRHGERGVLHHVDLAIDPNQTIGIVGASGAGKTTFFNLLTGLLDPTSGEIAVGGESYAGLDKGRLRQHIGYVPQDPVVLNDTVANNIAFWRCDPGDPDCRARIAAAAEAAGCSDFIADLGSGLDTVLGERGLTLSGGQRQRIAIARELFKEPQLLIFDEATSSLDAETERYVQDRIDRMKGQRTILIIAHRISTIRRCDRIYVFSKGRLVEEGGFRELYDRPGSLFRGMCDNQGVQP
ncbi:MAG: ABC transporter ATP-binding protein [Kiloniellales bacterium]